MLEKSIVLIIVYTMAIAYDFRKLRSVQNRGNWFYYGIIAASLYFSADFLFDFKLYDLHWLANHTLTEPAKMIVESLKVVPGK